MTSRPIILVVDDDARTARLAALDLGAELAVEAAVRADALSWCERVQPSLIVFAPAAAGPLSLELLPALKSRDVPVVVLSPSDDTDLHAAAMRAGADDHVVTPFAEGELARHVRFLLGLDAPYSEGSQLTLNDTEIDLIREVVRVHGELVRLSKPEWELLRHLAASRGAVVLYNEILVKVWSNNRDMQFLRTCADGLRRKLGDDPEHPSIILDFHGVGFCLAPS